MLPIFFLDGMISKCYNYPVITDIILRCQTGSNFMSANFCEKCGGPIQNGICTNCGVQASAQPAMQQAEYYPQQAQQPQQVYTQPQQMAYQQPQQPIYNQADQEGMFISPDEHVIYQMGTGYAQMFLAGGGITSNAAAITNKRVYYKGKALGTVGHCKITQVIDLKDISSVGIYRVFNIGLIIVGALIALMTIIPGLAMIGDGGIAMIIGGLFFGGLFILAAFLSARRILRIEHAGGVIAVDMKSFSKAECENFRINLFRAKDAITNYHA